MKKLLVIGGLAASAAAIWYVTQRADESAGARTPQEGARMVEVAVPADLDAVALAGKTAFETNCAACHGTDAAGRMGVAPPLVHPVYEPGHHGDMAFVMAARQGVRAHHWPFGDMPPVEGVSDADLSAIIAYIRRLQRENGIS